MLRIRFRSLLGLLALLWLAVTVSLYYVSHKPISPSLALSLLDAFGNFLAAMGIVSVGGGVGVQLLPRMELRPATLLTLQAALGLGILSLVMLTIGSLLGMGLLWGWIALLLLGILFWRGILQWWRSWVDISRIWIESSRLGKAIACGAGLIMLFTLFTALAPPLKYDALVYHLALPQAYLNNGRVNFISQNLFWGMPQVGEMLYAWAMSLAGAPAATCLGWMDGIVATLGLLGYVSERLSSRAAWIAAAALLSGATLGASLAWGYVDWLTILFGLGVLVAIDVWRSKPDKHLLWVAGAFAGLALGSKYTAGIIFLAGGALVLWQAFQRLRVENRWSLILSSLLHFALPAVVISLPWWIKNILATGSPFYPLLSATGSTDSLHIPIWGNWQDIFLLPIRATLTGLEGAPGYGASIGPLLLGLAPLVLIKDPARSQGERQTLGSAAFIGLAGLIIWIIASRYSGYLIQSRMYLSIFPALALLAGAGFTALDRLKLPGVRLGRVAGVLIALVFGLSVFQLSTHTLQQGALQVLLNLRSHEDYLGDNLGWYAPAMKAIRDLPAGSRVLMLWEPRGYYCAPKCIPDDILDRWLQDLHSQPEPISMTIILQDWRDAGYSYLLFDRLGADFVRQNDPNYLPSDWQALDDLLSQLPAPQDFGGAYQLYSLTP